MKRFHSVKMASYYIVQSLLCKTQDDLANSIFKVLPHHYSSSHDLALDNYVSYNPSEHMSERKRSCIQNVSVIFSQKSMLVNCLWILLVFTENSLHTVF